MEDFVIQNFKYGLDARRSELTSQPGTLQTLQDAHVNTGAEVDKRFGFFPITDANALLGTDGLEGNAAGITVFGDNNTPGAFPIAQTDGSISISLTKLNDVGTSLAIVLDSANYLGVADAIVAYANGDLLYWYGTGPTSVDFAAANYKAPYRLFSSPSSVVGNRMILGYKSQTLVPTFRGTAIGVDGPWATGADIFSIPFFTDSADQVMAFTKYQNLVAVFGQQNVATWNLSGASANFAQQQLLTNIGTCAQFSPQGLGDFDVLFLSYSGIRSLRVRDSSNNAFIVDHGSPVDALVQPAVQALTAKQLGTIGAGMPKGWVCSVVEPTYNRYWVYVPDISDTPSLGKIYVFSYFPNIKILAWSTYTPTYFAGGQQYYFAPKKMISYKGRVYIRAYDTQTGGDRIFAYGYDGSQAAFKYDATPVLVELPWLDIKKPSTKKTSQGIDIGVTGGWDIFAGMAPSVQAQADVLNQKIFTVPSPQGTARQDSSFDLLHIPFTATGTHFKMIAKSNTSAASKLSMLVYKYNMGNKT